MMAEETRFHVNMHPRFDIIGSAASLGAEARAFAPAAAPAGVVTMLATHRPRCRVTRPRRSRKATCQ